MNGAEPSKPTPHITASAYGMRFLKRLEDSAPIRTPVIPDAHVIAPKIRPVL